MPKPAKEIHAHSGGGLQVDLTDEHTPYIITCTAFHTRHESLIPSYTYCSPKRT